MGDPELGDCCCLILCNPMDYSTLGFPNSMASSNSNLQLSSCPLCQLATWWFHSVQFSSVHSLNCVWLFVTPWTAECQASLSVTNSLSLLKLMPIESMMPSNHLILCRPPSPPASVFPGIRIFSNESVLRIRWPKCWSFSFSINPSNEYSGLISFRMDGSPCCPRDSQESSLQKHQFFSTQLCL